MFMNIHSSQQQKEKSMLPSLAISSTRKVFSLTLRALCLSSRFLLSACDNSGGAKANPPAASASSSYTCASHSSTPVTLTLAYTTEKQAWMKDVAATFIEKNIRAHHDSHTVQTIPH